MLQTSVEIVKPGGTGRPAFVISARPAPLPPSRSFMFRLPSAFPLPKKYTCFLDFDLVDFAVAFLAINDSVDRFVNLQPYFFPLAPGPHPRRELTLMPRLGL